MDYKTLIRLNNRLGDNLGRNPHNGSVYRWFHTRDLKYPSRTADGGYEHLRQIDEDRWILAMWMPPPSEAEWHASFPDLGYPHQGMYYATDMMLKVGLEPDDRATDVLQDLARKNRHTTFLDKLQDI